jgi:hypothetical protein
MHESTAPREHGADHSEVTDVRRYRLVDRYTVHAGCDPLNDRIEHIIPSDAEYVVFDLDRTVHIGLTIGECLGWEVLSRPHGPGPDDDYTASYLPWRSPGKAAARIIRGLFVWGLPGLVYAATVRLGDRWDGWHRLLVRRRGVDYVERMQELMRSTLMSMTAGYTHSELQTYAARAWQRWNAQLVVTRESIDEIRRTCPNLRGIVLSSASTEPTVAHAAAELGVDGFVSSTVDVVADGAGRHGEAHAGDVYTGPADLPRWITRRRAGVLSRPGAVIHNAAEKKVSLLRMRYPEIFAQGTVSVAVSDNNYGEDRSWSDHFVHVIGLNSKHPYSPIVHAESPCRSIHAVDAAPQQTPVRPMKPAMGHLMFGDFDRDRLEQRIGVDILPRLEYFAARLVEMRDGLAPDRDDSLRRRLAVIAVSTADTVARYNEANGAVKAAIAKELARLDRKRQRVRSELARGGRQCARVECEIELLRLATGRKVAVRVN